MIDEKQRDAGREFMPKEIMFLGYRIIIIAF
jgi:hypothetical protein